MKISYTILTTPRKEPYLQRTIASLEKAGFFQEPENVPLHLVAGSPQPEHLNPYRHDPRFVIHDMTKEDAGRLIFDVAGVALRATWGHRRCLYPWRANEGAEAVLVMEDDIRVTSQFAAKLRNLATEIRKTFGTRWVMTGYTPQSQEPLQAMKAGKKWIFRGYDGYYGAQAILYPIRARDEYMMYLVDNVLSLPHDLALPVVLKTLGIPLLASAPCLVQHMGSVTQGVSGAYHHSESFQE
jgi:hypothetical protein